VVQVGGSETSDLNLMKLAVFMGIPVRDTSLTGGLGAQRDGMDIKVYCGTGPRSRYRAAAQE